MFQEILQKTKNSGAIIESITNYVTVNDCANAVLAVGGSPIMGDFYEEVEEIISFSKALVLNIGQLNDNLIKAHKTAGVAANKINIPIIFDPVGAGISKVRNDLCKYLLENVKFSVIKGNASEINYLINNKANQSGCDVSKEDEINETNLNIDKYINFCKFYDCILVVSGKIDLVCDKNRAVLLKNGDEYLSKITGAGCMLGHVLATFVASNEDYFNASIVAVSAFNISAQLAKINAKGTLSFKTNLIDELSKINAQILEKNIKMQILKN